jgi:hypothetical protein
MNSETSLNALVNDGGTQECKAFVISNFRHVVNVVFFLLGDSLASELYVPANKIQTPGSHRKEIIRQCKACM